MFNWISGLIEGGGYFGLLFLMFIENVFPPIPSELIMPFAGYGARQGKMSFFLVVLVGALGSVLGSLPLYFAGKKLGEKRIKQLADDHGAWLAVSGQDVTKAKKWFDSHRVFRAVFLCDRGRPGRVFRVQGVETQAEDAETSPGVGAWLAMSTGKSCCDVIQGHGMPCPYGRLPQFLP